MRRVHGKLNLILDKDKKLDGALYAAALGAIQKGMVDGLVEMAPTIQKMPEKYRYLTKHFHQFTGNTVASYTAAVVDKQKVVAFVQDESAPVVHELIDKGETLYLDDPVEGNPRDVTGSMPMVYDYGQTVAEQSAIESAGRFHEAGLVLASGPDYTRIMDPSGKTALVDIWSNVAKELENYAASSKFAWHIKKCIAQAINNYGK
jgi:hypothetical protein